MTDKLEILLLCGSMRSGSTNSAVLRTAQTLIPDGFTDHYYTGLGELPHFNPDNDQGSLPSSVVELRARLGSATAILICTPEYAGALPGSFKNLLDWTVGGNEIGEKPTAWINASGFYTAAADAHASLRRVLTYTGADIVEDACTHIPVSRQSVSPEGLIGDPETRDRIAEVLRTLIAHATGR